VLRAGRVALEQLGTLAAMDAALAPTPVQLAELLAELEVFSGTRAGPGLVTLANPLALRARRVRALFACGLQEGVFPAPQSAAPFFGDSEREEIAVASGLRLRRRDDLGAERYLFYATVSRPEERLYLCWHDATDDGDQAVRSFFVADVCDLFGPELSHRARTRSLGEVGWRPGGAPTERERLRGKAVSGPRHREAPIAALSDPELLGRLRDRPEWSAAGIELWATCPVKWFVERLLEPEGLTPDPELLLRGALAHGVLEATLRGLAERTGSARLTPDTLATAQQLALDALQRLESSEQLTMSRDPSRQRALAHRLRADLLRYLEHACNGESTLVPDMLEVNFGSTGEYPALELAGNVRLRGRIDRVDTGADGQALVYDYKGRNAVASASWRSKRKFQVALYMLAARDVLGLDPVGGLYQPLGAKAGEQRARGLVLESADLDLDTFSTDRHPRSAFDAIVDGVLEDVMAAVAELRAGALEPRPQSCTWNDSGCAYPSICRCEAA
jgi:hypothetical protein